MAFCNKAFIGKQAPAHRAHLSRDTALAYAAATDDDNPLYAAPDGLAPPLSLVTLTLLHGAAPLLCDPDLFADPMALLRLVHLEEDITWHRPLRQGMQLVTRAVLADIQERSSGEIIRIEVDVRQAMPTAETSPLASVITLMFVRGASAKSPRGVMPKQDGTTLASRRVEWTVAADQSERYADASGDHNPIHVDDAVARASGLKSRILHGLCTMAFAQRAAVAQFAGGDPARLARLRLGFARPVYPGDTLTWEGAPVASHAASEVATNRRSDDGEQVAFAISNQAGRTVGADGLATIRSTAR